jgi:hypothetical protein
MAIKVYGSEETKIINDYLERKNINPQNITPEESKKNLELNYLHYINWKTGKNFKD